jgi:hypothetical protein
MGSFERGRSYTLSDTFPEDEIIRELGQRQSVFGIVVSLMVDLFFF